MKTKPTPHPAPEGLATEQLVAAAESAIGGIQEHLANDGQNAKWSLSDGDASVTSNWSETPQASQSTARRTATHDLCPLGRRPAGTGRLVTQK